MLGRPPQRRCSRLGPAQLPTSGSLYPVVVHYQALAGLTAEQFLATYWNPSANGGNGGWNYPPDNGYLLTPNGQPIESEVNLGVGQRIDRFGSPFGAFLAPMDTPYGSRALPRMSLVTSTPRLPATITCTRCARPSRSNRDRSHRDSGNQAWGASTSW